MSHQRTAAGLQLIVGQYSGAGAKAANEDAIAIRVPDQPALTTKGAVAVIADGVSAAEGGGEASATAVTSFLCDYYSTHDTWSVERSAGTVIAALNRWLYGQSSRYLRLEQGYVTTFSAAVFKSASAYLFHVGDCRIHRFREGELEQLTRDHSARVGKGQACLTRALGVDINLDVDFHQLELREGDLFLLTSDGVHDWLSRRELGGLLDGMSPESQNLDELCCRLATLAAANGSDDNLSVQAVWVCRPGAATGGDVLAQAGRLPFPPSLVAGQIIDGWRVVRELHASTRSEVYLVEHGVSGGKAVLKAPSVIHEDDPAYIERFLLEEWIGSRVSSGHVAKVIRHPGKTFLYYLTEYLPGPTLAQLLRERSRLPVVDAQNIIVQVISGLRAFHRRDVVHQDIKPDNILYTEQGVKIIDFGACLSAGLGEIGGRPGVCAPLGTRDYSAPEALLEGSVTPTSDQFSLAVLFYELLTGALPFGEAYGQCRRQADFARLRYIPAWKFNPLVPLWLDGAIRKALSFDPAGRYGALSEFAQDIKTPNPERTRGSLVGGGSGGGPLFWKVLVVAMAVVNLVLLVLLLG